MKVVIDGVEYSPKDEKKICIHGINYNDVPHWLMNIHGTLVSDWVNSIKENGGHYEDGDMSLKDRIDEFERLCKEYLGFQPKQNGIGFEEFII